jgi:hypothetical protein
MEDVSAYGDRMCKSLQITAYKTNISQRILPEEIISMLCNLGRSFTTTVQNQKQHATSYLHPIIFILSNIDNEPLVLGIKDNIYTLHELR